MKDNVKEKTFCSAIQQRRVIAFSYKAQPYIRTFKPYVLYKSTLGKVYIEGWQVKNISKPSLPPEWQRFESSLMTEITILDETFKPNKQFTSLDNKKYGKNIICAIDRPKMPEIIL